jgi:hypothetical protein
MMQYEIVCAEPWASSQSAALSDQRASFDYQNDLTTAQWYQYVCPLIPKSSAAVGSQQLTLARVPVLSFNGDADPTDQPRNMAGIQQFWPDSREIALPGQGHYVTSASWPCESALTQVFIEQASVAHLDTSCLAAIPAPPSTSPCRPWQAADKPTPPKPRRCTDDGAVRGRRPLRLPTSRSSIDDGPPGHLRCQQYLSLGALGAEASGSHQVVTADGASGREGQPVHAAKSRSWLGKVFGFNPAALNWPHAVLFLDVALVPLVIFWAVGHEEYLLSALFGVLFTMLADPGGSYGHRASHTAVFGLIGAGVTALGRRENRERSCYHAASVEVTVRVWSAKLATSSRCPPSAWT